MTGHKPRPVPFRKPTERARREHCLGWRREVKVFGRERPVADLPAGDFGRLRVVTDHVRNGLFAETVAAMMGRGLILSRSKNG